MLESHVETYIDWTVLDEPRISIWRFFKQSATQNDHLLCFLPTIHNSSLKICPKFQVLNFHFSEVCEPEQAELFNENLAKMC